VRYEGGIGTFLTVLDAERTELSAEPAYARIQRPELVAAVTLRRAPGGAGPPRTGAAGGVER
jgi:outer membrane protein TolC